MPGKMHVAQKSQKLPMMFTTAALPCRLTLAVPLVVLVVQKVLTDI